MPTPASASFIHRGLHKITATPSLLKTLPTTTCAVCIDNFICQDELIRLPFCHHIFHRHCILPWLSRNNTCPLCRRAFPPEPPTTTNNYSRRPRHLRQQTYSVPITIDDELREQVSLLSRYTTGMVVRLNFHLRPPSSSGSNPEQPISELARLLIAVGYPQWASRACGPFWVSTDPIDLR